MAEGLLAAASAKTLGWGLPNMASVLADSHRCRAGCRILLVHGAMYDSEAGSHDDYALGFAALFDQYLARDSDEKVTVLVDVRGGDGWPNPRPWSALPWLRVLARPRRQFPGAPQAVGPLPSAVGREHRVDGRLRVY